ncbi:MAG: hypothetical protein R3B95_04620 [Nitrospirales bacterium]|nr:hypothetical protein [Nitrospirales bacterium]
MMDSSLRAVARSAMKMAAAEEVSPLGPRRPRAEQSGLGRLGGRNCQEFLPWPQKKPMFDLELFR